MTAVAGFPLLRRPPRRRWVLLPVALALLLHGLLLRLLPVGVGDGWHGGAKRAVQVRSIVAPARVAAPQSAEPPAAVAMPPRPQPARVVPSDKPVAVAEPPALDAGAGSAEPIVAPAEDVAGTPVPVYRTRIPPAALLRYDVRRRDVVGDAELSWRSDGARYELTLATPWLTWRSVGGFDAAGIAPERFVDRRRRDARAANFRRDSGRITYSGPPTEWPLVAGAQDRLSWMLQVAAIVDADPARHRPGERIALFVTGARADADVWTFDVASIDDITLPFGRVDGTLHLRRDPTRPYDLQVDVWLDPARSHLPVRVRLAVPQTGDATEMLLREQLP